MEAIGRQEGQRFAGIHPGPCFTNDMIEEFTDLVECYRTALAQQLLKLSRAASGVERVSHSDPPAAIKRLGQNFLIDPNIVRKIVDLAALGSNDSVLEIGPGRGILTEALYRVAARVTAIEVDPRLHAYLTERQAHFPNLTLVLADAMTYPIENLPSGTIVVANLPYYISTPLLFRLLGHRVRFPRMGSEYHVAVARWEQSKAQYEQTVTSAFAETTTVLYAREKIEASIAELKRTVGEYREMVRLANVRYDAGVSDYFEVLYAMQLLYPAEVLLVNAQLNLTVDYVNIYRALGGGWNKPERPPDEAAPAPAPSAKPK